MSFNPDPNPILPQEKLLLDPMFEVPNSDITRVHVDEAAVLGRSDVQYTCIQQSRAAESDSNHNSRTMHEEDSVAA